MTRSIWATLGIAATNDEREIRRAYARMLKTVHPEDDPAGFQALREAHDQAMRMAKGGWAVPRSAPATLSPTDGTVVGDSDEFDDEVDSDYGDWGDDGDDAWQARPGATSAGPGWDDGTAGPDWTRPSPQPEPEPEPAPHIDPDLAAALEANRQEARQHDQLIADLNRQIGLQPNNAEAALEALLKVLRSPAMGSMQIHSRTEYFLADLLVRPGEATASLIDPVAHFFGWDSTRVGTDLRHAQSALQRREALAELRRIQRPESQLNQAWKVLSKPMTTLGKLHARLSPSLAKEIWTLLDRADYGQPLLADTFNPETEAWWRDFFAKPRLGPMYLLFALFGPPIITAMVMAGQAFESPGPLDALALWVLLFGAIAGLGFGWIHGIAKPSRRWQQGNPWQKPLALRFGWVAAAVPLTLIGALVPPLPMPWSLAVLTLVLFAWLALAIWARLTTSHVGRPPMGGKNLGFGFFCLVLLATPAILSQLLGGRTDPMTVNLLGLGLVAFLGRHALVDEWLHLDPPRRRQVAWSLIAMAAGAVALAGIASGSMMTAVALAVTSLAALPGRLLPRPQSHAWASAYNVLGRGAWAFNLVWSVSFLGENAFGLRVALILGAVAMAMPTLIVALAEMPWPQGAGKKGKRKRMGQA